MRAPSTTRCVCLLVPSLFPPLSEGEPDRRQLCALVQLSEDGYIVPGLGDSGDRLFSTQP